jgi:hypothetical protein
VEGWDADARPIRSGYSPHVVQMFCVRNHWWQQFRLRLKGKTTRDKITCLEAWYDGRFENSSDMTPYEREVQVGNYLGALRRGGQLDANNQVKRDL